MSKLNLQVGLNSFADKLDSNQNFLNHFKWLRSASGVLVENPQSVERVIAANDSTTIHSGTVLTDQDSTTEYDLLALSGDKFKLSHAGGTRPGFRDDRNIGCANDTEVTITVSGDIATLEFTDGTLPDLSRVVVGDEARVANRGIHKVLSKTVNSISVSSSGLVDEVFVLSDAKDFVIYSRKGVQKEQKVVISNGFLSSAYGEYPIVDVGPDFIVFTSTKPLMDESLVLSELTIFESAKKLLFVESNQSITAVLNGKQRVEIRPLVDCSTTTPALVLLTGEFYEVSLENANDTEALIYCISAE